jgi:superfamily II DNA or RNA helicase
VDLVVEQSLRVLATYRVDPRLIEEHANGERRITQGGYGDRQVYELVQNAADELRADAGGEIGVVLTSTHLYCANEGSPVTPQGVDTILRMGVSRKRGGQIGRFGVGIKSVLSVSDAPQFFSRSGCFGFDREWSAEEIRSVHPQAEETPVLRMGRPLDLQRSIAADPVLAELMKWATTVVRLPLKPESVQRLGVDLRNFPVEFPLFSPHVGTVTLEDRRVVPPVRRTISQMVEGDRHTLQEEKSDGSDVMFQWRVFTRTVKPSKSALESAGELHDRPEIDLSWAVPDRSGRIRPLGTFWAYFPTNYATLLRGILNAPWKTSEDRQNLYKGNAFNDELINEAARLVVGALPELSPADDPAAYIDLLPGRGKEAPQWADRQLTLAIWAIAADEPSLPDQQGVLRRPAELMLHPEGLKDTWLKLWAGHPGRPVAWCHHSVESRERRARAERIMRRAEVPDASVRQWLEALVEDRSPEASIAAVRILADIVRTNHPAAEEARKSRILLTETDGLVAPVVGKIFRRSSDDNLSDSLSYVHTAVSEDFNAVPALETLGIHEAHAVGRFSAVVEQGVQGYTEDQWVAFWELSRQVGPDGATAILLDQVPDWRHALKVRTLAGSFRRMADCLMPGRVVPADGSRDAAYAVDVRFHDGDRPVLRSLGLTDVPATHVDPSAEPWFDDYVETAWNIYCKTLSANSRRPQLKSMQTEGALPAGPLHFLAKLSEEGRAAFLKHLPSGGLVTHWTVRVGAQLGTRQHILSPLVWMARRHGFLQTSLGLRAVHASVSPALGEHRRLFAVADVPIGVAEALKLPETLDRIPASTWTALLKDASVSENEAFPGQVYALVLEAGAKWTEDIGTRCRVGTKWASDVPDEDIAVTADRAEYESLVRENIPALLMPTAESAELMIETYGMASPVGLIQKELRFVPTSEPTPLTDEFPHLVVSYRAKVTGWTLTRCRELEEIISSPNGERSTPIRETAQDQSVLVKDPNDDLDALLAVDRVLKLGLGRQGCQSILNRRENARRSKLKQEVRQAKTVAEKIHILIGPEMLKSRLPQGLIENEEARTGKTIEGVRLAELAIDAFGPGLLRAYAKDISANVDGAPSQFNGSNTALQFVNELGLPDFYAGTKIETPPSSEKVDGPTSFPRLHDYQERLAANMYGLLAERLPGRAMLSLPTGAGKTRIAAESVIRRFKEHGLNGPVLWIAQTWELCEQAVQSWKFVWQKVGPEEPLTINRLWNNYEAAAVGSGPQLVVATDAKLESVLEKDEYSWLREASLVIVDEAHSAYSRMTPILKSLGITHSRAARPLIGLSATPYRGFNEEETRRLTQRFGHRRLDDGVFPPGDPFTPLQELGVLARVEHRELRGATLELSEKELKDADFRGLPASAEWRLEQDDERNEMLLAEIKAMPDDWPVLFFATSVNHARLMSAILSREGIPSAAIDSGTPAPERRAGIDAFRAKRIRVLTNYNVLAQGFDAPATRAVVVARPTYSPNMYTQMIGRGLRGPLNGGKEVCTILDVHDNIVNYDRRLAFTEFEDLWRAR